DAPAEESSPSGSDEREDVFDESAKLKPPRARERLHRRVQLRQAKAVDAAAAAVYNDAEAVAAASPPPMPCAG
ncbi:unnamed protein product, partial [Urochloa humidicola]